MMINKVSALLFGIRAEVEYFDFADDTYMYSLGAAYTF